MQRALLMTTLLAAGACSDTTVPGGAGRLDIEVSLRDAPDRVPYGEIMIFTSIAAFEVFGPMVASPMDGGPRDWTASFQLAPGIYYARPCFTHGCPDAIPRPFVIEAGEVSEVELDCQRECVSS